MWFDPWVRKIPWRRKWQPTPGFLLGNPMDRGAWSMGSQRIRYDWARIHKTRLRLGSLETLQPLPGESLGRYAQGSEEGRTGHREMASPSPATEAHPTWKLWSQIEARGLCLCTPASPVGDLPAMKGGSVYIIHYTWLSLADRAATDTFISPEKATESLQASVCSSVKWIKRYPILS